MAFLLRRGVAVSTACLLAVVACGSSNSGSSGTASPATGSALTPQDDAYCAADRQRNDRCYAGTPQAGPPYTDADRKRCVEAECLRRAMFGVEAGRAMGNCFLERPCNTSKDICQTMVLGTQAQSPAVQQAFGRCAPFEQRCGLPSRSPSRAFPCAIAAHFGPELTQALAPCYDMPCELGRQCVAGHTSRIQVACQAER